MPTVQWPASLPGFCYSGCHSISGASVLGMLPGGGRSRVLYIGTRIVRWESDDRVMRNPLEVIKLES